MKRWKSNRGPDFEPTEPYGQRSPVAVPRVVRSVGWVALASAVSHIVRVLLRSVGVR